MSNIPTFSLSPVTLSSREALHEILVIMGNFLLVNRTLELLSLVDVDSAVLPGITYVRQGLCMAVLF